MRTIRLDPSDTFVFEKAAEPGEWAVSGAFEFWDRDPATLEGKARSAFRGGFLGVDSLGRSTLVQIVEASEADRAEMVDLLAQRLVAHFGAPDMTAAGAAAEEEVAFAESLCNQPQDTLVAVHRTFRGRRGARNLPQLASARGAKAGARLLLPRGRGRGRDDEPRRANTVRSDRRIGRGGRRK